jgi:hypothetical protein
MIEKAWMDEGKTPARLGMAFAQAMLGKLDLGEFTPFTYLINTLNSASYREVAQAYLIELARDAGVRTALYGPMDTGTKDEKIGLARVLARSGDKESVPHLQKLSSDTDNDVAHEGERALRTLQAHL